MPIAFIHPSVTESRITCDFTVCSTAFKTIDKHSIYFCVNILLMGEFTVVVCEFPSIRVRNARHPVVFVSDNTLTGLSGILMNYQLDAPSYQNLYNSLKAGYWHLPSLRWVTTIPMMMVYWLQWPDLCGIPEMPVEVTRSVCFLITVVCQIVWKT